uniref:Uncharacterized protein n=1 Tax=Otus sunia TaxID=257818 RepID=A0A8C8A8Y2_9STRI
ICMLVFSVQTLKQKKKCLLPQPRRTLHPPVFRGRCHLRIVVDRTKAEEGAGAIPFSASEASPRVWSVRRSMGSDHERPWVKVLPLSLLCSGLLLWCVFRERTEIDERLEQKNKPTPAPPPNQPQTPDVAAASKTSRTYRENGLSIMFV